jgi:ATP-dependent protease HslVU (ClpYQ) peptidase subunit
MTCIVGYETLDGVFMGGDSASVGSLDITIREDSKVFRVGGMVMGFTTSWRMGQLLRYSLKLPDHKGEKDDFEYLCTDFIDAVRECLKQGGYAKAVNNEESGGVFLLGYRRKLYRVDSDFHVGRSVNGYNAIGSGECYALGALMVLHDEFCNILPAKAIVTQALEAAARFSTGVSAPFTVIQEELADE